MGPGETEFESPFHLKRKSEFFHSQDDDKVMGLGSSVCHYTHRIGLESNINMLIMENAHNVESENS